MSKNYASDADVNPRSDFERRWHGSNDPGENNSAEKVLPMRNDSQRTPKFVGPIQRPAHGQPQANRSPQEKTIDADEIASKTWIAKWWTGEKWEYLKAARLPKLTAKFISQRAALEAAKAQSKAYTKISCVH